MIAEPLPPGEPTRAETNIDWSVPVFALAVAQFAFFTGWTLEQPSVDMWGFRPAQTAVSIPYMLRDGAWLANVVPIFGEPWVWPLEFPVYQWCVAALAWATNLSIDSCGRLISAFFAVATIWPVFLLGKSVGLSRRFGLILGALWLLAPVTVFWGRVLLIETTIVFLGACWLAFYVRYVEDRGWIDLMACTGCGILAAVVKITGFIPFVVIGFLYTCVSVWRRRNLLQRGDQGHLVHLVLAGASVSLAAGAFFVWIEYTDHFMQMNPLAAHLRYQNLTGWYLGFWSDRLGRPLWDWTIRLRALPEALGFAWPVAIYGLARIGPMNRLFWIAVAVLIGYLSAFVLFPQLHINHPYYQVENAIMACAIVALAAEALSGRGRNLEAMLVVTAIVAGQLWTSYSSYYPFLKADLHRHPYYLAGQVVRDATPPDSVVVGFGMGYGAELPYFANRRAVVVANGFAIPAVRDVLFERRDKWFGGRKLGAVVDCKVFGNQAIGPNLVPIRDGLKQELAGKIVQITGVVYGATVDPPSCDVFLPSETGEPR